MANVVQFDCASNLGRIKRDLGSNYSEVWVDVQIAFNATYLSTLAGLGSFLQEYVQFVASAGGVLQELALNPTGGWTGYPAPVASLTPVSLTALQFYQLRLHMIAGSPITFDVTVDSVSVGTYTVSGVNQTDIRTIALRANGMSQAGAFVYMDNLNIGTTAGATDIYTDDFEGTLGGFSSVFDATIVADPGIAAPVPPPEGGISIGFDDPALEESPTWTDIDLVDNVQVQTWSISRGRPTERDNTGTGTATVTGMDLDGVLDPTNTTGPYYVSGTGATLVTKLNPVKQIRIRLYNPVAAAWSTIFRGFVDDWGFDLDLSENFTRFEIQASDALEIFSDVEMIADVAGDIPVAAAHTGDIVYDADTQPDARINAALADAALAVGSTEWPSGLKEIFTGNVQVQEAVYSPGTPILQVIDDAAAAEFPGGVANRYVSKTGVVTFHGRLARFDPTNPDYNIQTWKVGDEAAYLGDSTTAVIAGLKFNRGKDNLINYASATPKGIADADRAGQLVTDTTSRQTYGARSITFDDLLTGQGNESGTPAKNVETKKYATYYVDNYKDPRTRVSQIVFRPQGTSGTRASNVWDLMCGIEISDIVSLTTTHPGGGGFDEDFFVEGISYDADVEGGANFTNVTLTLDVSPKAYYDTDPGFS